MHARTKLGRLGEGLAADLYGRLGFEVADRNWHCGSGELDLVLQRGDLVIFCEVKTRRSDRFGVPAEAVDGLKQARLRRLAAAWLAERSPGRVRVRFDVVSVIVRATTTEVTHLPEAF
ncbi:MAG: YraN family protein [Actinomycetota bacterium]